MATHGIDEFRGLMTDPPYQGAGHLISCSIYDGVLLELEFALSRIYVIYQT
jgi:hypothetical protein